MRWNKPTVLSRRQVRKFLLLPTTANGQTRWLEVATINQTYIKGKGWRNSYFQD